MLDSSLIALEITAILFSLTTAIEAILVFCRQKIAIVLVFGVSGACVAFLTLLTRLLGNLLHRLPIYLNIVAAIFYLATGIGFILELVHAKFNVDPPYAAFELVIPSIFIINVAILSATITASLGKLRKVVIPRLDEESADTKAVIGPCFPTISRTQSLTRQMPRITSYPMESMLPDANDSRLLKMASDNTLIDHARSSSTSSKDIDQLVHKFLHLQTSFSESEALDSNWMDSGARLHSLRNDVNTYALLPVGSCDGGSHTSLHASELTAKVQKTTKHRKSALCLLQKAYAIQNTINRRGTMPSASCMFDQIADTLLKFNVEQKEQNFLAKQGSGKSRYNSELENTTVPGSRLENCELICSNVTSTLAPHFEPDPNILSNVSDVMSISDTEKNDDTISRLSTVGEIDTSTEFKKKSSTALLHQSKDLACDPILEHSGIAHEEFTPYFQPKVPLHPDLDNCSRFSDRLALVDYFQDFNAAFTPGSHADLYKLNCKVPAIPTNYSHDLMPSESSNVYRLVLDGLENIASPSSHSQWDSPGCRDADYSPYADVTWYDGTRIRPNQEKSHGVRISTGGDVLMYDRLNDASKGCADSSTISSTKNADSPKMGSQCLFPETSTINKWINTDFPSTETVCHQEPQIYRILSRPDSTKLSHDAIYAEPRTPNHSTTFNFKTPTSSLHRDSISPMRQLLRSSPRKPRDAIKWKIPKFDISSQSCPGSAKRSPRRHVKTSISLASLSSTASGGSPKKAIKAAFTNRASHRKSLSMLSFPPQSFPTMNTGKLQSAMDRRKTLELSYKLHFARLPTPSLNMHDDHKEKHENMRVSSVPGSIIGEYDREKWETLKTLQNIQTDKRARLEAS